MLSEKTAEDFKPKPVMFGARKWTNSKGKSVQAFFVELTVDEKEKTKKIVVLERKSDKKRFSVPLTSLSSLDQNVAEKFEKRRNNPPAKPKIKKQKQGNSEFANNKSKDDRKKTLEKILQTKPEDMLGFLKGMSTESYPKADSSSMSPEEAKEFFKNKTRAECKDYFGRKPDRINGENTWSWKFPTYDPVSEESYGVINIRFSSFKSSNIILIMKKLPPRDRN